MMFRALPPSGVPVKCIDVLAGLGSVLSGENQVMRFNRQVCRYFGVRHAITVSSGRAALSLLLTALSKLYPERNEVLIPAYTSFSVPSSVVNAGFRISLYDVDPATLSPVCASLAGAVNDKTLCIVVCHLYGFPGDLDAVLALAQERLIPVIDDAAQAMGASYRGKQVGTFGAAGLFSLSRGKNITAVDGGIIVTDDDTLAEHISAINCEAVGLKDSLMLVIKALLLSFLLHPRCYWLPRSIPSLNIGASVFNPDFKRQRFTAFQAGIAARMLVRLDAINAGRRTIAEKLTGLLGGNPEVKLIQVVNGAEAVFLRFPVRAALPVERPEAGVVKSYPAPIQGIPGIEPYLTTCGDFPGASMLADHIMTLPTHCYVADDDCILAARAVSGEI